MSTKPKMFLIAAALLASTTLVSAYEDPENKIGDRYPFLDQGYQPIPENKFAGQTVMPRQVARLPQYDNEVPENKIGDRYPFLDQGYRSIPANMFAGLTVMPRQVAKRKQATSHKVSKVFQTY